MFKLLLEFSALLLITRFEIFIILDQRSAIACIGNYFDHFVGLRFSVDGCGALSKIDRVIFNVGLGIQSALDRTDTACTTDFGEGKLIDTHIDSVGDQRTLAA